MGVSDRITRAGGPWPAPRPGARLRCVPTHRLARERGNLEMLIATPVSPWELTVGKILPFIGIGLVQTSVVLVLGDVLFDVPLRGSLLDLYLAALVFITANLSLGIFISTLTRTQFQAMQLSFFTFLPQILLSGFMFPYAGMPEPAQWLAEVLPLLERARHGIEFPAVEAPVEGGLEPLPGGERDGHRYERGEHRGNAGERSDNAGHLAVVTDGHPGEADGCGRENGRGQPGLLRARADVLRALLPGVIGWCERRLGAAGVHLSTLYPATTQFYRTLGYERAGARQCRCGARLCPWCHAYQWQG